MKTKEEILEYIDDIDLSLMLLEDTMKGQIGDAITKARGQLEDIRKYHASQFQQELPKVKDIVKKFIDSDEPDTFIRNEHGVLMYYSHDKQSGINLESYFEDLVQYVFDEISAKSPQPYNPTKS